MWERRVDGKGGSIGWVRKVGCWEHRVVERESDGSVGWVEKEGAGSVGWVEKEGAGVYSGW